MATQEEIDRLRDDLKPIIQAAIDRGEDLSTPEHMQRFIERVLEQQGFALRGDVFIPSNN